MWEKIGKIDTYTLGLCAMIVFFATVAIMVFMMYAELKATKACFKRVEDRVNLECPALRERVKKLENLLKKTEEDNGEQ